MDKIASVRIFLRVAKSGSFARAAEQSGISATSASRLVRELEDSVQTRLLNRSTRSLSLTKAGEKLFAFYDQVIAEWEAIEAEVAGAAKGAAAGRVRAALPNTFSTRRLHAAIHRFSLAFPHVELEIRLDDAPNDLIRDGFDVAVRIATALGPAVVARRLSTVQTVLCASPDYVRWRGDPAAPSDLSDHECLLYTENREPDVWEFMHDGGIVEQRVTGSTRANNGELLTMLATAGRGITLQPAFVVSDRLQSGELVRVMTAYETRPRTAFAIYPSHRFIPAIVRTFTDYIAVELDNQRPPRSG